MTSAARLDPRVAPDRVLWEGRPTFRSIAFRVWHLRMIAFYFLILLGDGAVMIARGNAGSAGVVGEARLLVMGVVATALLAFFAWLTRQTTLYTITEQHVMMKFGIGLPRTLEIPFGAIAEVKLRVNRDQSGDIALRLNRGQAVMFLKLWPHVRGWASGRSEPMLRSLPEPGVVAALLCRTIAAAATHRTEPIEMTPAVAARGQARRWW